MLSSCHDKPPIDDDVIVDNPVPDPTENPTPDPGPMDGIPETNRTVVTVRPLNFAGYVPSMDRLKVKTVSKYHVDMPELDYMPKDPYKAKDCFVIDPDIQKGWFDVPLDDPDIVLYCVKPGNIVDWGVLPIQTFAYPGKRKVVRYWNPEIDNPYNPAHAYHLYFDDPDDAVIMEGIHCGSKGPNGTKVGAGYWTVYNIAFAGVGWNKKGVVAGLGVNTWPGSEELRISNCLFYKWIGGRMMGDGWVFQDNVCITRLNIRGDHGGFGAGVHYGNSFNGRVIGNEFIDGADLFGTPKDGEDAENFGHVNGLIVDGNTFYWTEYARAEYAGDNNIYNCGGDAFDLKNGSDDPDNPVIITNNIIMDDWPTPPDKSCGDNTGSIGQMFLIHKDCTYILCEGNIGIRGSVAITTRPGTTSDMYSHDNAFVNNLFVDMPVQEGLEQTGTFLVCNSERTDVVWNSAFNVGQFFGPGQNMTRNIDVFFNRYDGGETGLPADGGKFIDAYGNIINEGRRNLGDLEIWVKPITGPEKIILQNVVLHEENIDKFVLNAPEYNAIDSVMQKWFWPFL